MKNNESRECDDREKRNSQLIVNDKKKQLHLYIPINVNL